MFVIRDIEDIQKRNKINDSNYFDSLLNDKKSKSTRIVDSAINVKGQHLHVYSLLTTSDKEINVRCYPDEHVKDMAKQKKWTTPYPKPLMLNHDIYSEALGRFNDTWYLDHQTLAPEFGNEELPQAVIDEFALRKCFVDGKGSTVGKAMVPSLEVKRKIIDMTYYSTSQGAMSDSLKCNICDEDYWSGNCIHSRGMNYPIVADDGKTVTGYNKCVPYTGALDAIEDSIVNRPANSSSSLIVYDSKAKKVVNLTNIADYGNIFNVVSDEQSAEKTIENGNDNKLSGTEETGNKIPGLTDEEVNKMKNKIEDKNTSKIENKEEVNDMVLRDAAKEVFMFKAQEKLQIADMTKVQTLFEELSDAEVSTALKLITVLADAEKKEIIEKASPIATLVSTEDNKEAEKPTQKATEDAANVELKKQLNDMESKFAKLIDAMQNMDGINNNIPGILATVEDTKENQPEPAKKSRFKCAVK